MKNLLKIILPIIVVIFFSGCYTVVWNPSTELPSENDEYNNINYYYEQDFYGDYNYYYSRPWWWALTPPAVVKPNERSKEINTIRNNDGGRNSTPDRGVVNTDRPTVDSNNGSNSGNDSTKNSNDGNDSPRKSNSDSGNNSNTQTRSSNNGSGNNSIRNNDGSRNSGSRR